MVLDRMQEHLEAIYGTRCGLRVSDFLVGPQAAKALDGARESVFVREDGDALELKVFVSPESLRRLENVALPTAAAEHPGRFFEALEGVSHFLYLCRSAELERKVSMLELEAQGEVDKFAAASLLHWQEGFSAARSLYTKLFDTVSFAPQWGEAERWRYEQANRLAKSYCAQLLKLIAARRLDALLAELRHTYRMGAEAKLSRLALTSRTG
jgi:hypothetical protein